MSKDNINEKAKAVAKAKADLKAKNKAKAEANKAEAEKSIHDMLEDESLIGEGFTEEDNSSEDSAEADNVKDIIASLESEEDDIDLGKLNYRPKSIDREANVVIMNITDQQVYYHSSRTNQEWTFMEYGQTDVMTVSELINMNNRYKRYLNDPWLIILDSDEITAEDVISYLGLTKLYENVLTPSQINKFFNLRVDVMEKILRAVPIGIRQTIVSKALQGKRNGTLDSISKIKMIQDVCNVDFDVVS